MPDDYQILFDAPTKTLAQIQVAKLGDFSDARYGDFSITADEVQAWKANLAKLPGGKAPIDFDHLADKPGAARKTEAAGWITGIELADGVPTAQVEWTPVGESAITEKRYQFFSPSYGPFKDEHGQVTPDVLQGGALTNKPFLNMPTVNLSRSPLLASEATRPAADSRPSMPTISLKTLTALGLDEGADEAAIESAVTELKTPPEPKTLEAQAADEGKILLSREDHDKLKGDADKAGALEVRITTLEAERADEKFTAAFDKARSEGRLDAKDETRELHKGIFAADPQRSLVLLASLPKIVNTTAHGSGGHDDDIGTAPAGVDPDAFELDAKVQAYIAANPDTSYVKALDAVQKER